MRTPPRCRSCDERYVQSLIAQATTGRDSEQGSWHGGGWSQSMMRHHFVEAGEIAALCGLSVMYLDVRGSTLKPDKGVVPAAK